MNIEPYRGFKIEVTPEGKFTAVIHGKRYKRASLASLRRFIDQNSKSIDVMLVSSYKVGRFNVIGIDKRGKYREAFRVDDQHMKVIGNGYSEEVYPFDQELYDWFEDWFRREEVLKEEKRQKLREISHRRLRHSDLQGGGNGRSE